MKPIPFKDANRNYTGDDVDDLPAWQGNGLIISLWRPSFRERLFILFRGVVTLAIATDRQPPISLCACSNARFDTPLRKEHDADLRKLTPRRYG